MKIDKIRQSDIEKLLVRLRQRNSEELEEVSQLVRSIIKKSVLKDQAVFEYTKIRWCHS